MRKLTANEINLIRAIALRLPTDKRKRLMRDMQDAAAENISRSRIVFAIKGYDRPIYKGQHPFPLEGKVLDQDGSELTVLLHADENERLLELEIIRFDEAEVIGPDWSTLSIY